MARYYFHLRDGEKAYDDFTGADLLDDTSAAAFAQVIAGEISGDSQYDAFYVDARDENDKQIAKVFLIPHH